MNSGRERETIAELEPELAELDQELETLAGLTTAGLPELNRDFHLALEGELDRVDSQKILPRRRPIPLNRIIVGGGLAAAACLAVVVGISAANDRPAGEVLYSQGSTQAVASNPGALRPGNKLSTADGRMVASLESRITMMLNAESSVTIVDSDRIALERGEIWVHVKPGSGHFRVDLPSGEGVDVIGTSFTVTADAGGSSVETYSGIVRYGVDNATVEVVHGQKSRWNNDESRPTPPIEGSATAPGWTTSLIEEYHAASMKTFFPSVAPAGKK